MAAGGYRRGLARLPNGRWRVRKWVHGELYKRTFPTRALAEAYLRELEAIRAGLSDGSAALRAPSLTEAVATGMDRLAAEGASPRTQEYYAAKWRLLVRHLGGSVRLSAVTQEVVRRYTDRRRRSVSPGEVAKELGALRRLYSLLGVERRWRMPRLRHVPQQRHVYSIEEVARLWAALEGRPTQVALGLALMSALRAEEALRAERSWLRGRELHVPAAARKARRPYVTWVPDPLYALLPDSGRLVGIGYSTVRQDLERASARIGLDPVLRGLGSMRHHAATWLVRSGRWTRYHVSELLGHSSGVTDRYVEVEAARLRRRMLEDVARMVGAELEGCGYNIGTSPDNQ